MLISRILCYIQALQFLPFVADITSAHGGAKLPRDALRAIANLRICFGGVMQDA